MISGHLIIMLHGTGHRAEGKVWDELEAHHNDIENIGHKNGQKKMLRYRGVV